MTDKYIVDTKIQKSSYSKTIQQKKPSWTFTGVWNKTLDEVQRYPIVARDYLWASALGSSQVDIWLSLNGKEHSNPFDSRVKRKFDAGEMWEWIVELVSKRAGIFIDKQGHTIYQIPNKLKVTGKYDLKIGGKRNTDMIQKMKEALQIISLPKRFIKAMENVENKMNFKTELPTRIIEVKSSSAYMYDAQYKKYIPSENHALQCYHYLLGENCEEGAVLYISKDDSRMIEIPIWKDDEGLRNKYNEIIELATMYYEKKEKPPLEPNIIFNVDQARFTDNWNIKYSSYLTYLYGFEHESDYQDAFKSKIASWNRVLGRIARDEKMTKNNLAYIEEIKSEFKNYNEIIEVVKKNEKNKNS